jgi:hypothetical protein
MARNANGQGDTVMYRWFYITAGAWFWVFLVGNGIHADHILLIPPPECKANAMC